MYWLAFSARTLRLVEVAEIVAMDAREEPRFNPGNRLFDSKEILVICSSLVTVFTDRVRTSEGWGSWPCIELAHFSVKEYLTSVDIQKGPAKMYAMSRELANTLIAESCLALLLHFNKPDSLTAELEEEGALSSQSRKESLHLQLERTFPLAQYAAVNWIDAYNASSGNDFLEGLVSELFIKKDSLENWIRLRRPEERWWSPPDLSKPSNTIGPSIYYASEAGLLQLLKQLIQTGADVNARGGLYGNTLQAASYNGHQGIIHLLLDKGADINASGGQHGSALQAASFMGHENIVQILLDAGADVNAQGGECGNALHAASFMGHENIVQILLDAGADVNTQGGRSGNALHAASLRGHQEIVEILLDEGADVNTQDGYYGNSLQAASFWGYQNIVQILLDAGADVNAQGGRNGNALHAASLRGHQKIVQILLDAGADVNTQGGGYENALQAALSRGYQDVAQILRDHGAHEDVKALRTTKITRQRRAFADPHHILHEAAPQPT